MQIKILKLLEGARQAEGLTVIIDVFRAFSTVCYIYAAGAEKVIAVGDIEKGFELKQKNQDLILIGEGSGSMIEGCDYGNSPTDVSKVDFSGKQVILRTGAGTQGIVNANTDEIIAGAFVNAQAIADYIKSKNPEKVSIVAMGVDGEKEALEDNLFAEYLRKLIEGKEADYKEIYEELKNSDRVKILETKKWFKEDDFELSMNLDKFDFVLKAQQYKEGMFFLERI